MFAVSLSKLSLIRNELICRPWKEVMMFVSAQSSSLHIKEQFLSSCLCFMKSSVLLYEKVYSRQMDLIPLIHTAWLLSGEFVELGMCVCTYDCVSVQILSSPSFSFTNCLTQQKA